MIKLSREAKKIQRELIQGYKITDPGGQKILQIGLEAFDRMRGAQERISDEGIMIDDRYGHLSPHPMIRIEKESRAQVLQAFKLLNLDFQY